MTRVIIIGTVFLHLANGIEATGLQLSVSGFTDLFGNVQSNSTQGPSFEIDTIRPYAHIFDISVNNLSGLSDTSFNTLHIGNNTPLVTIVFSQEVTGFNSDDDITVSNGTLSTMTSSDNITWTGTFTPDTNHVSYGNTLNLSATYRDDISGNLGLSATSNIYDIDTVIPVVNLFSVIGELDASDNSLSAGETATVTIEFSEPVINFDSSSDIIVDLSSNGTLSQMTSSDDITWTGTFTPTTSVTDTSNTLTLKSTWTDRFGNPPTGENISTNYSIDTKRATVISATAIPDQYGIGNTLDINLKFSETVVVSGTPRLTTDVSGVVLEYLSGSGSDTLIFRQTSIPEDLLDSISEVNIVSSYGNKYVFNGDTIYDPARTYKLTDGTYVLTNIPINHPLAILNIGKTTNISYSPVDNSNNPIVIKVSGGQFSAPYYTFTDGSNNNIDIDNYKFMRGKTYRFDGNGISGSHPFKVYVNGYVHGPITGGNIIFTIGLLHSITPGDFYYQCNVHSGMKNNLNFTNLTVPNTTADGNYDFYYGDVTVSVNGDFEVSVYCYNDGYMGGENLLTYIE